MSKFFAIAPGTSLRDSVREEIKRKPQGMKVAAAVMGVSHTQTVTNYTCNTKRGTHTMSLDQFENIIDSFGGQCIAQAVAELAGGIFVPTKGVDLENIDVMAEIIKCIANVAELSEEVTKAIEDKKVDDGEWGRIRSAKFKLYEAVNRLIVLCAQMRE